MLGEFTQKKAYHNQNKVKKFEIKKHFLTISAMTHFFITLGELKKKKKNLFCIKDKIPTLIQVNMNKEHLLYSQPDQKLHHQQ